MLQVLAPLLQTRREAGRGGRGGHGGGRRRPAEERTNPSPGPNPAPKPPTELAAAASMDCRCPPDGLLNGTGDRLNQETARLDPIPPQHPTGRGHHHQCFPLPKSQPNSTAAGTFCFLC